jgi:hypothetical protein
VLSDLDNGFVDKQFPPSAIPQTPTSELNHLDSGSEIGLEEAKPNFTHLAKTQISETLNTTFEKLIDRTTISERYAGFDWVDYSDERPDS